MMTWKRLVAVGGTCLLALVAFVLIRSGEEAPRTTPSPASGPQPERGAATSAPEGPILVELVYEQAFGPLGERTARTRVPAEALAGFVLEADRPRLHPAMGGSVPSGVRIAMACRIHAPSLRDPPALQWLEMETGDRWSWDVSQRPNPRNLVSRLLASVRVPIVVEIERDGQGIVVRGQGGAVFTLAPGQSTPPLESTRDVSREDYWFDGLGTDRLEFERRFELPGRDDQGRSRIHGRLTVFHRGTVELATSDLRSLEDEAFRMVDGGRREEGKRLLDQLLSVVPGREPALALRGRIEQEGIVHLLAGRVSADSTPGGPIRVLASLEGDEPDHYVASVRVVDGMYQMWLPTGRYQIVARGQGLEPVERTVHVEGDNRDVDFELVEPDRDDGGGR